MGNANTFTEAVELLYAEAWRLGEEHDGYESGEIQVAGGTEAQQRAADAAWREALGAQKALGVLLNARGEVGRRRNPSRPDQFHPCIQQTWIRLMQWAIARRLTTQDKLDEVVSTYPQYIHAMKSLGSDVEPADFVLFASGGGEQGA